MWWSDESGEVLWWKLIILHELQTCEYTRMEHKEYGGWNNSLLSAYSLPVFSSPETACDTLFLKVAGTIAKMSRKMLE